MSGIPTGGGLKLAPPLPPKDERQELGAVKGAKPPRSRDDVHPQIRAAAEGMESMFVDYMMKTMRQTVQKSEMSLDNSATEIYQSMLDSEVAQKTARTNSIGLADQIIAYLETRSYNQSKGPSNEGRSEGRALPLKPLETGETHQNTGRETGEKAVQEVHHAGHSVTKP